MASKPSDTPLNATLAEYIHARLEDLKGKKTLEQIAHQSGYAQGRMIARFAAGEVRVPLNRTLLMATALEAPLIPFFRLAMAQYGGHMAELAETICSRLNDEIDMTLLYEINRALLTPTSDRTATAAEASEKAPQPTSSPEIAPLSFDVPLDFHRRFQVQAAIRGLSGREMLMLAFEYYLAYRDQPGWAMKSYFPALEDEEEAIGASSEN